MERQIWEELERRYDGFTREPLRLRLTYFEGLQPHKVKELVGSLIQQTDLAWPSYLLNWYVSQISIITENSKSIGDIMSNVNHSWKDHTGCVCDRVTAALRAKGCAEAEMPPRNADGHYFFPGRAYAGPFSKVMNSCCANIPNPTHLDLERAWERVHKDLPPNLCSKRKWVASLSECYQRPYKKGSHDMPCTRDAYSLRKILDGLVIGPMDKNNGELTCCCPVVYNQSVNKLYCAETGYEEVFLRKATKQNLKEWGAGCSAAGSVHNGACESI